MKGVVEVVGVRRQQAVCGNKVLAQACKQHVRAAAQGFIPLPHFQTFSVQFSNSPFILPFPLLLSTPVDEHRRSRWCGAEDGGAGDQDVWRWGGGGQEEGVRQ